jgi:hypothetical protein
VPELLVLRGGQHEAGQFQDFVCGEAVGDGDGAYPGPPDEDNCRKGDERMTRISFSFLGLEGGTGIS